MLKLEAARIAWNAYSVVMLAGLLSQMYSAVSNGKLESWANGITFDFV